MPNPKTKIEITAVDKTKAAFRSVDKSIGKVTGSMKMLGGAAGGLAIAGAMRGLYQMTMQTAALGDKIDKLSSRLGVSSAFLTEMRYAAESAGVGFDTLTMAFQRMERRLGEIALTGKGEALPALNALGMSIKDLDGLNGEQQFLKLANGLSKITVKQEQLSVAMKLFDSEGVRVIQMLEAGGEGLAEYAARAQELGVVMDNVTTRKMADMTQASTDLRFAMEGLQIQFVSTFGEQTTDLINSVTEGIVGLNGVMGSTDDAIDAIAVSLGGLAQYVDTPWFRMLMQVGGLGALANFTKGMGETPPKFTTGGGFGGEGDPPVGGIRTPLGGVGGSKKTGKSDAQKAIEEFDKLRETLFPLIKLQNDYYANVTKIDEALLAMGLNTNAYEEAAKAAAGETTIWGDAMVKLTEDFEKAEDKINDITDGVIDWNRLMGDALGQFASDFADSVVDSITDADATMEDFARNFIASIAKMILKAQMLQMMKNAFPTLAPFLGVTAQADGGVWQGGKLQAFASGGVVTSPTLFPMKSGVGLMGEAGAEAILPLSRKGGVLGVKGNAVTVNNVVHNNANGVEVSQRQTQDSDGNTTNEFIIEAMEKAFSSGRMDSSMSFNYGARRRPF